MSFPVLPEWATDDETSPISLQNNVVKPPDEKIMSGWTYKEKPVRQWANWLARQTYLCIQDLRDRVAALVVAIDTDIDLQSGSFTPAWNGLDSASITDPSSINVGYYSKVANMMTFTIHTKWIGNAATANLEVTNIPFSPVNVVNAFQTCKVTRGTVATLIGLDNMGANNGPGNILGIWTENAVTGLGASVPNAGASGELIITGSYIIEV